MDNYHPVVEILVERYGTSLDTLEPLHEQILAYKENTDGLKEVFIKHKVISEEVFQKALASYYELEYRENFTMIQSRSGPKIEHQIDNRKLIINHVFPLGNTQIMFHYNLGAWFGSLNMQREFNHSLDKVSVFTPSGQLQINSAQLIFSGKQQMHETDFLTWKGKASDSNQLKFIISNVPVDSLEYIGISVIILLLLFLLVIMFYRKRLIVRDRI